MPDTVNHQNKKYFISGLWWLPLTFVVLLLDRVTKWLALKELPLGVPLAIYPHLNFTLSFNRGAAFSLFANGSGWQNWFFGGIVVVASVLILVLLARYSARRYLLCAALALVLGGALGNGVDRYFYGSVIDFIDLYINRLHWPIFNLADSAICLGAFFILLDALRRR